MRKLWRALWILWVVLAVVNLLFVNVYINHLGTDGHLDLYQQLGYLGISALFLMLCGVWWLVNGRRKHRFITTTLGIVVTAIFGVAIVGGVIYALAFGGAYLGVIVDKFAQWFSFLSF